MTPARVRKRDCTGETQDLVARGKAEAAIQGRKAVAY